jgi:hypothetical protein
MTSIILKNFNPVPFSLRALSARRVLTGPRSIERGMVSLGSQGLHLSTCFNRSAFLRVWRSYYLGKKAQDLFLELYFVANRFSHAILCLHDGFNRNFGERTTIPSQEISALIGCARFRDRHHVPLRPETTVSTKQKTEVEASCFHMSDF